MIKWLKVISQEKNGSAQSKEILFSHKSLQPPQKLDH